MASGREEERERGGWVNAGNMYIRDRSSYKFLDKKETSVLPAKCGVGVATKKAAAFDDPSDHGGRESTIPLHLYFLYHLFFVMIILQ